MLWRNGFCKSLVNPSGSYSYQWDSDPLKISDSLVDFVNKTYQVQITDDISLCSIIDTVTIPGYDNLIASFFPNTTECVSLLSADFQFLDNSIIKSLRTYTF